MAASPSGSEVFSHLFCPFDFVFNGCSDDLLETLPGAADTILDVAPDSLGSCVGKRPPDGNRISKIERLGLFNRKSEENDWLWMAAVKNRDKPLLEVFTWVIIDIEQDQDSVCRGIQGTAVGS